MAPALVSTGSPTASIFTVSPALDATLNLKASWRSELDIHELLAGRKFRLELVNWSKTDLTTDDDTPLAQFSRTFWLDREVAALPSEDEARAAATVGTAGQDTAETIRLTPTTWAQINKINRKVNRAITSRTDLETYGQSEVWATPLGDAQRFGDCEDYVLEKRRALIAAGFPPKALSIAVVLTPRKERHAVLLVNGEEGEYVLDNLNSWVTPWDKTEYLWRERQVAGSANHWASVQPAASTKDDPDYYKQVLLASLY